MEKGGEMQGKGQQERRRRDEKITLTKKGSHQWHFKKMVKTVKAGGKSDSFQR